MNIKSTAAILGLVVMAIGPLAGLEVARAETGKANGNSASHSNSGNSGNSRSANASTSAETGDTTVALASDSSTKTRGKSGLASELKGLNAVKANPNALNHANPNSQVGRIAAYRDAATATINDQTALTDAQAALAALAVPGRGVEAVAADIAALDPLAANYAEALAALQAERDAAQTYADAQAAVDLASNALAGAAEAEHAALLTASNGRELSDAAIAYIRSVLNL